MPLKVATRRGYIVDKLPTSEFGEKIKWVTLKDKKLLKKLSMLNKWRTIDKLQWKILPTKENCRGKSCRGTNCVSLNNVDYFMNDNTLGIIGLYSPSMTTPTLWVTIVKNSDYIKYDDTLGYIGSFICMCIDT